MKILFLKAIGPNERWITVKPPGHEKGQPLLIRDEPGGTARVIGGAGGSMNFMKLKGVKSKADYAKESGEKQKQRAAEKKEQAKRDKEAGTYVSKQKEKQAVFAQVRAGQQQFIKKVSESMGWENTEFPEEKYSDLSDAALSKLRNKHHAEMLKQAHAAVALQKNSLLSDADARSAAGIGEVPLTTENPEQLSVADLDPVKPESAGLGYSTNYKERAEDAGLTESELKSEAESVRSVTISPEKREAAIKRGESAKLISNEIKNIRETIPTEGIKKEIIDVKKAVELIKAEKQLKQLQRQARDANKEIDKAVEPKAYVLEVSDEDPDITTDLENDLKTIQTRTFLSSLPDEDIGRHIGIGAFNSINALAMAAGGDSLIDRSVVDVLGIAGAAQVLSRRLHNDLPTDQLKKLADGMEAFHVKHYMQTTESALKQAESLKDEIKDIDLGSAETGHDFAIAQELNAKRREAINAANQVMGTALGEMEANASLVAALKAKDSDMQVSMGNASPETIIKQARAIGLQRGDYQITTAGNNRFLSINADGMDRLAKPVNSADLAQVKNNLEIINGKYDEENWLPKGISNRPDLDMPVPAGVAPSFAEPFKPGTDLEKSISDYIGGRAADGDTPADIISDLQSNNIVFTDRRAEFLEALDKIAPAYNADGKLNRAESHERKFNELADKFVNSRFGVKRSAINSQKFDIDSRSVDALHRALAEHPEGVAAYKQIGDLSNQDQKALRDTFYREIAKESPEAHEMRDKLDKLKANEPEKVEEDIFGDESENPQWTAWRQERDELSEKLNSSELDWNKYTAMMRGHENAYAAIQDLIKSKVSRRFAEHYNRLNPDSPLKTGRAVIRGNLNHLDAVDPEARAARQEQERERIDAYRERNQGRYAAGSVKDKLDAGREQEAAYEQAQMGLFGDDDDEGSTQPPRELGADERHTIGHEAERQIAAMMNAVGKNFKPGEPVKLWNPTMSGGKNYPRQRAIKLLEANKRVGLHFGVGSGKTLVGLAGFSHLHGTGTVKRGIFAVPSIVQGQFGGEALRYLEPGKFNWHCKPGASRDERIAAYKDPDQHFCVVTHQSLRDDLLHLGAQHAGIDTDAMRDRVAAMSHAERKAWGKSVMDKEGINFDYMNVDEGHNLLDRQGKDNSGMSNVLGAISANTPYYMSMTGDAAKNDLSEVFSALQKMDPERYSDQTAFMRKYGVNTAASKDQLKREMARYFYPSKIDNDVSSEKKEISVDLSDEQKAAMKNLDKTASRARLARMQGKTDVEAMKEISPESFADVPDSEHEKLAGELQRSLGIMKESARSKIINAHQSSAKLSKIAELASERKGKPGVVFAHTLDAVEQIKKRLEADGHKVVTLTGKDSSAEKERKRSDFQDHGNADILVASDAAATGANLQRGQWLVQYDTPQTAMGHSQRRGRIDRIGQKNNIELMDLVANHPSERAARKRLAEKYQLRDLVTSPMDGLDDTGLAGFLKQREVERKNL